MFITSHTEEALSILADKIAPLDLIDKSVLFEVEARLRSNIVYAIKRLKARQLQSPRLFNYSIDSNLSRLYQMSYFTFKQPLVSLARWDYMQNAKSQPFRET